MGGTAVPGRWYNVYDSRKCEISRQRSINVTLQCWALLACHSPPLPTQIACPCLYYPYLRTLDRRVVL